MKKITLYLLIVILHLTFYTEHCLCQSGWFYQPLPLAGGQILDLRFFDANTGLIAVWQPNLILRTTNGGFNWYITLSNQPAGEFDIIDSNAVYARAQTNSAYGMLLRSYDRGATWDSLPVANSWTVNGISFVNRDTGWIGGTSGGLPFVWRTTNGGLNWAVQFNNSGYGNVYFLKEKVNGEYIGWSLDEPDATYKTTNSGVNWFQITNVGSVAKIYFIDANTGFASSGTNMKKTTNGGLNWINQPMPSGYNITGRFINNFKLINKDTIYGVGGYRDFPLFYVGIIWITTNSGTTWNFQQPDTSIRVGAYKGIDFVNKDTGWSSWIRTNDGGGPIIITGINPNITIKPELFILEQNYPNPFNSSTKINFSVSKPSYITLTVYDITGKEVLKIYNNEFFTAGNFFTGIDLGKTVFSSGIYIYSMTATDLNGNISFSGFKKMVYLK